jgi:hypothetical protein
MYKCTSNPPFKFASTWCRCCVEEPAFRVDCEGPHIRIGYTFGYKTGMQSRTGHTPFPSDFSSTPLPHPETHRNLVAAIHQDSV